MKRLLSAVLLVVLAVAPFHAFAQDGPKTQEYATEDGVFSLMYPADWVIEELVDVPLPGVGVANTQDALDHLNATPSQLQSGDAVIETLIFPVQFLSLLQIQLPDNATPGDMASALAIAFLTPDASNTTIDPASIVVGKPEEIMLGENEDIPAGYVTALDSTAQGAFIVRVLDEDSTLLAVTIVESAPDEFTDELATQAKDLAATVTYTGTADEIMTALMGSGDTGSTGSGDTGSTGTTLDGAALVQERCTTCHSASRITRENLDEAGWTRVVDQMIAFGAQLNADERQAVIDYLVATY